MDIRTALIGFPSRTHLGSADASAIPCSGLLKTTPSSGGGHARGRGSRRFMTTEGKGAHWLQGWDTDEMDDNSRRVPGSPLNSQERALLELLCSGNWPGTKEARQQAARAHWGGLAFDDCDDFLIEVSEHPNLPRIPPHPGGPFASLEVLEGETLLGHLNLWAPDGVLHSVDFMTFGASDQRLPPVEQLGSEPFAFWLDSNPVAE